MKKDAKKPNGNDIVDAFLVIQEDLRSCKDAVEMGMKYKSYMEIISRTFGEALADLEAEVDHEHV